MAGFGTGGEVAGVGRKVGEVVGNFIEALGRISGWFFAEFAVK